MSETMGDIIRKLRKERDLTQEELADQIGVTSQAVSKWENSTGMPDISQVVPLAAFFGVSVSYLRGESDDPIRMESWLSGNVPDEPIAPDPAPRRAAVSAAPGKVKEDGAVFGALLKSPTFQALIKDAAAEYLRSPEGQALIAKAIRRELDKR